jgi:hypothetical protein
VALLLFMAPGGPALVKMAGTGMSAQLIHYLNRTATYVLVATSNNSVIATIADVADKLIQIHEEVSQDISRALYALGIDEELGEEVRLVLADKRRLVISALYLRNNASRCVRLERAHALSTIPRIPLLVKRAAGQDVTVAQHTWLREEANIVNYHVSGIARAVASLERNLGDTVTQTYDLKLHGDAVIAAMTAKANGYAMGPSDIVRLVTGTGVIVGLVAPMSYVFSVPLMTSVPGAAMVAGMVDVYRRYQSYPARFAEARQAITILKQNNDDTTNTCVELQAYLLLVQDMSISADSAKFESDNLVACAAVANDGAREACLQRVGEDLVNGLLTFVKRCDAFTAREEQTLIDKSRMLPG